MKVILPITITDSILTSSSIAERDTAVDPAVWSSGTTYSTGNTVYLASTHKVYELISTTSVTGGLSPDLSVASVYPKWTEVGYTNRWAMFDTIRATNSTSTTGSIVVKLTPTTMPDSLAVLGMAGISNVNINVSIAGPSTIYSRDFNLNTRVTDSWSTYFFGGFNLRTAISVSDLPSSGTTITITFTGVPTVLMTVGALILGTSTYIGKLQYGATVDALNFSTVARDAYGNAIVTQRRNVPKTSQTVFINKANLDNLLAVRKTLDATPAVWSGLDDQYTNDYYDPLLILGFYRTFDFELSNPIGPIATIELEEV